VTSAVFAHAAAVRARLRADYEQVRGSAYLAAEEATRGALVNARGKRAGIDAYSLFMGSGVRARAYASEELLEHWESHPRLTFTEYERQMMHGGASW
jgi:hypothetical protein